MTRAYFENISEKTAGFSVPFFKTLADETCLKIVMAILSMSEISFYELQERLALDEAELNRGLDILIQNKFVFAEVSKHKSLGTTYTLYDMYHSGLCILLATMEMTRKGLEGISCCMGYGDYPINI